MELKDLIPVGFGQTITPVVHGDKLWNERNRSSFIVAEQHEKSIRERKNNDHLFIVAYSPRKNNGKRPVGASVVLDFEKTLGGPCAAIDVQWARTTIIPVWSPNFAYVLNAYKNSLGGDTDQDIPEFTQEMLDNRVKPPIGSKIMGDYGGSPLLATVVFTSTEKTGVVCEIDNRDSLITFSTYKPLPTEEEKIRAELLKVLKAQKRTMRVGTLADHVDSLMASRNLIISLRKD